jgi:hypothetical protein
MWEKGGPDFNTRLAYQAGLTSFFHTKKRPAPQAGLFTGVWFE